VRSGGTKWDKDFDCKCYQKKLVAIFLLVEAFVLFGCLVLGVWLLGFCFNFYCMKFGEGGWGNNKGREGSKEGNELFSRAAGYAAGRSLLMLQPEARNAGSKPSKPAYAPNVHKASLQHLLCTYLPQTLPQLCNLHIIILLFYLFIYNILIIYIIKSLLFYL